jgi:Cu-processing system permease protein
MENFFLLVRDTFREHIRHRLYLSLFLFGFVLLTGGLVISALAIADRPRMMLDFGLAGIEFLGLTTIVFVSVNLVLTEIENRTIYLVLSRPIPRGQYILGRFAGTTLAVASAMAVMALLHVALLLPLPMHGVITPGMYVAAWGCEVAKLIVVGSLSLALALFSTSAPTAMTFTLFLWAIGHFSEELHFLGEKSANGLLKFFVWVFYHAAPNFSYFNYRDFLFAGHPPSGIWFFYLACYAIGYTGICLWIAAFLFSRKEF